ncbi:MAG: DUF4433 domain-containing protein, partial [Desulfarculaceae bacterium]
MNILVYHITHIRNLSGIIQKGGLLSDSILNTKNLKFTGIAYDHIKRRRLECLVTVPPGGTVGDYVPFYFAPRSPMLYTIHRGNVENYHDGQEKIIYLVAETNQVAQKCE